jgi:hypothetical protein
MHRSKRTFGREVVYGVVFALALVGYWILRFPAAVREGSAGNPAVAVTVLLIALYGLAGWQVQRQTSDAPRTALRQGAVVGLALGGVMILHLTAEHLVGMDRTWSAITSLGLFPVLFLSFGWAGFRGAASTGSLRLGIAAALWSAMLCILLTVIYGLLFNYALIYAFPARMENIYHFEFVRSGIHDLHAFVVANCLEAAASHLVLAPILATVFGTPGGLLGKTVARRRKT